MHLQAWVPFVSDTLLITSIISISLQIVLNREFAVDNAELDVNGAAVIGVDHTVVVSSC